MRHPTARTVTRSWWVLRHSLRRWPGLVVLLAATGTQMLVALLLPWPLKILVDNVLLGQPLPSALDAAFTAVGAAPSQQELLYLTVGATVVFFVIFSAADFATRLSSVSYGQRLTYDVASELFERMQRSSQRADRRTASGDMLRRVTQDSACVSTLVTQALIPTIFAAISLVLMLAIMIDLDARLAIIAIAIAPLMLVALVRYMMPMADRGYEREEAEAAIYTVSERALTANAVVQVFAREDLEDARFRATTSGALEATLRLTSVQLRFKTSLGLLLAIGSAAVLWVGATTVLGGGLTVGAMLVFFAYLTTMYSSLETIAYAPATVGEATGSLRRVAEVLDAPPEIVERPGAPALPPVRGHLRVEGVVFGYEPGRAVLRGVRFEARPGETVALVGATGAGKSTLASLVPRLVDPWLGQVTIDGHDLREVSLRSVREQVAVVLQEPFLFPITIAENIAYGRPGASRWDIEAAARAADAHGFIERLPAGYDTIVGERGATLSGGERQRLSIARALLKDAPILVLDEPTSALDAGTELTLLRALERLMADRTTLVIAHRLSTVRRAHRIVVLHEGRVAEMGTHDELLAVGGLYAYLYRTQFRDDDDEGLGRRSSGMLVLGG